MRFGIFLRNFGPASTRENIAECAQYAESVGIDDLWLSDHIAIPPEESEGSGGRYLDPLATLAFLAGKTSTIGLGTSVLIVPYRPALVTAKWLATIQELSGARLTVGAAVGWMDAEFKVAGVDRSRRGDITDDTLAFWHSCFENDEVELNKQRFIFKPRPSRPKFLIGGAAPHAIVRAARLGDGWMPAGGTAEDLRDNIALLKQEFSKENKNAPEIIRLGGLSMEQDGKAVEELQAFAEAGLTGICYAGKYGDPAEFKDMLGQLLEVKKDAGLA